MTNFRSPATLWLRACGSKSRAWAASIALLAVSALISIFIGGTLVAAIMVGADEFSPVLLPSFLVNFLHSLTESSVPYIGLLGIFAWFMYYFLPIALALHLVVFLLLTTRRFVRGSFC